MSKIIDWQNRKTKDVLIQLYDFYLNSRKWGISYEIERMFYEKTGKRINYITLRRRMREAAEEALKNE